jgi:putative ATP-binding cassette transporter
VTNWNLKFFNALQMKDIDAWLQQVGVFFILGALVAITLPLQAYCTSWLQIRWRRWMTDRYLSDWLRAGNHYRMQLQGTTDNPDQRISIDVQMFVVTALSTSLGLLRALTALSSFIFILWGISAHTPLPIYGHDYSFPGYLVIAALIVAVCGTLLTHVVGRRLIGLNFDQQRYEADFRFSLVRVRENSEQIALLQGEPVAQDRLMDRFAFVMGNWRRIMTRTLKLGLFTGGFNQINFLVPSFLIAPSLLTGVVQFGTYMQTSIAFGSVEGAFTFFVTQYSTLAEWKAVIDRLVGFEAAAQAAEEQRHADKRIMIGHESGDSVGIENLDIRLPDGTPLLESGRIAMRRGERVLITGPSGAGKSTMFRAFGGIWPFGSGRITLPTNATVMIVPQKPYLPVGPLDSAITFPSPVDAWPRARIEEVMKQVGLTQFITRLDENGHWNNTLSLGEQQRVAIARAVLHKPDLLFLDEATASLDEPSEAKLYTLLREGLPESTIVSIGHRSALRTMHDRRLMLVKEGDLSRLVEDTSSPGSPARSDLGVV